ncbi:Ferredoxin-fold anticodon-binding domain-containing protein 1 [Symbiodinium microadriaticum]|uniref:Ferredoxin-fold anticodon-binding domain-containing protein 1 n=1 Tax=Symbiodinium microadriaticum TaxID=2951 RepID=A0A1Q9EA45_SYMMI|nr:Ferredoxin-fold anticodon-binding domain-containing protein 1 [Symbiodinium microadriaticum]
MGLGWLHPAADSSARREKVLVVGDGDLSFSAALSTSGVDLRLTATTLESREDLLRRYARSREHIDALEEAGAIVLHAVDATCLQQHLRGKTELSFDRIIFNFPYQATGGIKGLRRLLGAFLGDAAGLLAADGVIEVALCAGQGGTAADGPRLRGWAGSWRVPLLAARAGLALAGVDAWMPPRSHRFHYAPLREPGNKDAAGGAGGKAFPTEGALLHRFVCRPRAPVALVSSDLAKDRIAAAKQVLRRELRARDVEASWQNGPKETEDPECAGDSERSLTLPSSWTEGQLESAVRAMSQFDKLRWVEGSLQQGAASPTRQSCLEVLVPRPEFTPCFPAAGAGAPRPPAPRREDWLQLCWSCAAMPEPKVSEAVCFDLEVLAMIHAGVQQRSLLGETVPTIMYPCLFCHDLRIKRTEVVLESAKVLKTISEVCGSILVEVLELTAEESGVPAGERHWRLLLASATAVLDDRQAYAAYQAVRQSVASLGATLC